MQIVTFPPALIDSYLAELRSILVSGRIAEDRYVRGSARSYVDGRVSVPVCSGGAAMFALLAYQKHRNRRSVAIVQSNTMRALYTVPTLLGMQTEVVDSTFEDFLSMSPEALGRTLADERTRSQAVVLYSVIGGYLAPSFSRVVQLCRDAEVPLIVDAAHGHFLQAVPTVGRVDIAYSFYATKILPAGEGGLVTTDDEETYDWVRRFVMYDRFANELAVGLNLRASEATAALIHLLLRDPRVVDHFVTARIEIARRYASACRAQHIRYLDPEMAAAYNGYKFIVLDPMDRVQSMHTCLTDHPATSGVFDTDVLGRPTTLAHWCPPTYSSLRPSSP